jgi:hypothetical protein
MYIIILPYKNQGKNKKNADFSAENAISELIALFIHILFFSIICPIKTIFY